MTARFKILICLSLAMLVGCAFSKDQLQPAIDNTAIAALPTLVVSTIPRVTQPQLSITSTPLLSPTAEAVLTQTPENTASKIPFCIGNGKIISRTADIEIKGTIVYQKSGFSGLFTMGGAPVRFGQLPLDATQHASVYGFSLDGRWLAYAPKIPQSDEGIVFRTPVTILLSATGERIEQKVDVSGLEKELKDRCSSCWGFQFFGSYGEWINSNLLYVQLGAAEKESSKSSSLPKVFDPFTGTWQDSWLDGLPNLSPIYPGDINHIKLSPDLSRILYRAKSGGVILRDLTHDIEILFEQEFADPNGEAIQWSPDSKMVAVVNFGVNPEDRRLLLISRDGEVTKIVDGISPLPIILTTTTIPRWSPNNRYLAFVDGYDNANLYLYNTQTNDFVYRCPLPGMTNGVPRLVWSPDSQWIAFGDQPEGPMQLLNVQTGEVTKLLENAMPVGWSDKFPVEWP